MIAPLKPTPDPRMDAIERIEAVLREKFAPAIDFRAPYAKVMARAAAEAAFDALFQ